MDPEETVREIHEHKLQAYLLTVELARWIEKGGFRPKNIDEYPHVKHDVNQEIRNEFLGVKEEKR